MPRNVPLLLVPVELLHAERGPDGLQQDEVEQEHEEGEGAGDDGQQVRPAKTFGRQSL
jgi:hypothetical protein